MKTCYMKKSQKINETIQQNQIFIIDSKHSYKITRNYNHEYKINDSKSHWIPIHESPNWRGECLGWLLDMAPNARRFSGWFLIHITEVLEVKELDPIHNCCSPPPKKEEKKQN